MVDPADIEAKARRKLQLSRKLGEKRREASHPSNGGCRGFEEWYRRQQIKKFQNGEEIEVSEASIYRWMSNGVRRCRMNGNKDKTELVGRDLSLLVFCLIVWPQSTLNEMAMYIYNEGGGIYSRQLISHRLQELNVTQKKASIESYRAYTAANRRKEWLFWNRPLPSGIAGIPRKRLIDIDEFAMETRRLNCSKAWAVRFQRVRNIGNYTKGHKLTVIIAVEAGDPTVPNNLSGSVAHPRRWIRVTREAGTTADNFASFVGSICSSFEGERRVPQTEDWRVFMWDNLSSHSAPVVYNTILDREGPTRFDIVPRPPYQPKYGPTEYIICQLVNYLKINTRGELDLPDLEQQILQAAAAIGPFDGTFAHCGYSEDGTYPGVVIEQR